MKYVYAFQWCDCIYESGFSTMSLHETYAGAYKTMRKEILGAWDREFKQTQREKRIWNKLYPNEYERWTNPFWDKRWTIQKLEIQP